MTRTATITIAIVLAAAAASPAAATPPVASNGAHGVIRPHKGSGVAGYHFYLPQPSLQYYGGPVLRENETFAVFWDPRGAIPQRYRDLVTRYLKDVAADSGKTTNVYSVLDQYYDNTGPIAYSSTFAGSAVDTDPLPSACAPNPGRPPCITDQNIVDELDSYLFAHGIARPANRVFMVFTPPGVNVCFDDGACSGEFFCAYHGSFTGGNGHALYAAIPYPAGGCGPVSSPNGDLADAAIDSVSHEHRESIDDPLVVEAESYDPPLAPIGWFDATYGDESSDQCVVYYGPERDNGTGLYNQVINGHDYLVQTEWSNALAQPQGFGCVGDGVDRAPTADFSVRVHGASASFSVTGASDPDPGDSIAHYYWLFRDGSGLTEGTSPQHQFAAAGTYPVTLYVVDTHGATASATHDVTVGKPTPAPTHAFQAKLAERMDDRGPVSGSGNASGLGNVTENGAETPDWANFPVSSGESGQVTLSNKSGDRLLLSFNITSTDAASPPTGTNYNDSGTYVIQGGTGNFYGATGSGTITGTCTSSFTSDIATCDHTWKGTVGLQ